MRASRRAQLIIATLLGAAAVLSCAGGPVPAAVEPRLDASIDSTHAAVIAIPPLDPPPIDGFVPQSADEPGLIVHLREGPAAAPAPADPGVAPVTGAAPLSLQQTERLLARLPPLPSPDTTGFRFPTASPPPPVTGRIVLAPFPPPDSVAPPAAGPRSAGPLRVVRIVPTGDTELAAHLTITFSDAMVPLTTVAGTEVVTSPVRLTPQPPGRWSWVDTRTLRFEPAGRFPMATAFTVEVPAGTRSAGGAALAEAFRTAFVTPAPRAIGAWPALNPDTVGQREEPALRRRLYGRAEEAALSVSLQPVVLIAFDQRMDPSAVARSVRMLTGSAARPVRVATPAEVAADSVVGQLTTELEDGRWVAVRPIHPLPAGVDVRVVLDRGLPSAEGSRTTTVTQELRFRTRGPLRIESHDCSGGPCRPGQPWTIQLSNAIDREEWSADQVSVAPALRDIAVNVSGSRVRITGDASAHTRYVATLSAATRDEFGQQLQEPRSVTFEVGAPLPAIVVPGAPIIVLDPEGPPHIAVRSQGHRRLRVRLHRVTPEHWLDYGAAVEAWQRSAGAVLTLPGDEVTSTVVEVTRPGEYSETFIDVGPALRDGLGHAIVTAEPVDVDSTERSDFGGRRTTAHAWVQSTRIGLAVKVHAGELDVWASSLAAGEPLGGVDIEVLPSAQRAVTAPDGTARLPLTSPGDAILIASVGADAALLPANAHPIRYSAGNWNRRPRGQLRWYTMTDRSVYQPGETVQLKGWLRHMPGRGQDALRLANEVRSIALSMRGPRREELGSRRLEPNDLGGFSATLELPEELNLGRAVIQLEATGQDVPDYGRQQPHAIQVQEFRRPEYEVSVHADPGPYIVGDVIDATMSADYYGGGVLAGAPVDWQVLTRPAFYRPPGWDRWHFGRARWWEGRTMSRHVLTGVTDAAGAHRLIIDLLEVAPPFATSVRAEAQVHDLTRQIGSAATDVVVHPASANVGLRLDRNWVHRGQSTELLVVVVDHDGNTMAGRRVDVILERLTMGQGVRRETADTAVGRVLCSIQSGAEPAPCRFTVDATGVHRLRADARDGDGRLTRSELMLWVAGAPGAPDPRGEPGRIELVADREEYQPGDTARILVQPPFVPAEALVTISGVDVIATERVRIETTSHEIALPITDAHIPNMLVRVDLVDAERGVNYAFGDAGVNVSARSRALDVRVASRDTLVTPGGDVTVDVEVRDTDGRPAAGAEVALWMVDEAVLAIGNYALRDPMELFYARRYTFTRNQQTRQWVVRWPRSAGPNTLSGFLLAGDRGRALVGATVRLEGTGIETRTAFDGSFTLRDVAPGDYVLEAVSPDGTTGRMPVTVPAEGAHAGNVVLGPGGLRTAPEPQQEEVLGFRAAAAMAPPPPGADGRLELSAVIVTGAQAAAQEVDLRTDFAPLAFFEPSLRTDANGRVQLTARVPQSLTRYRIMAVAVAGAQQFGSAETAVTARRDLVVRIAAPRFLNYGDKFQLPVLIQNATTRQMTVHAAARASGAEIDGAAGRLITLGPGARAEVRFDARAPVPGTTHLQVVAAEAGGDPATPGAVDRSVANVSGSDRASDAAAVSLPVYTPATLEAFATYGTIDSVAPVVLPLSRPVEVIPQFGGVEVTITATALHSLTDAVLYLRRYPFGGTEHLASRVLAVAALRDVLAAFGAEGLPDADALVVDAQRDIDLLLAAQGDDGGWPFWRGLQPSHPFVTIHVAHALQRAQERGLDVAPAALLRALEYLRNIESRVAVWPYAARQSAAAYALYVRHRLRDDTGTPEARRLAAAPADRVGGGLSTEAAAWLLHVLADDSASRSHVDALRSLLLNRLVETAGTVTFASRYDDGGHLLLHSQRRTDAIVLEALIAAGADTDIIARLAQSLLAHRVAGRWSGTQENSWVLLALDRYFRSYEATTPAFESRVWLGRRFAGAHAFEGRTTDRQHIAIPMSELLRTDASELTITREGSGRMYYRAAVRYAPADPFAPATDRGFQVSRAYEAVDDPEDVQRDADGTWRVRAGARVRVRVSMVAPAVRYHAALVDPLPAGFEPLNASLHGTGFTDDPGARAADNRAPSGRRRVFPDLWRPTWFEHQNLRDDRAEAFASLLPAGAYDYTYLARATTPGTFIVPPARAEMMYQPETFGRGAGNVVIVQERDR